MPRFVLALVIVISLVCSPGATAATLYRGATLLTLSEANNAPLTDSYLLVSGAGLITAIGTGDGSGDPAVAAARAAPGFSTVDLTGRIVMPGFISGHSHLWQSAFRGIGPATELEAWLNALHFTYGQHFVAGDFAAYTKHGAYDQLRHGVTTTYNHSHFFGGDFSFYLEQFEAGLATPQRFIFAWVNDARADDATWLARLEPILPQVQPRADRALLGVAINAAGVYRGPGVLEREIAFIIRWMPRRAPVESIAAGKAADGVGGNCVLTEAGKTVVKHGVTLVGETNLPALVAADASALYARNVLDFLKLVLTKEGEFKVDMEDDIVAACLMTQGGDVKRK
jgi:hypothetical protein